MATGREFKEPISFEGARVRYRLQWRSTVTISTRWMESEKEYQSGEEVIKAKRQAEIDRAEDQVEFRAVRWVERIVWEEQVLEGEE